MSTSKKKLFLLITTLFSFNFLMADPCAMPENTISLDSGDVWYNVNTDIAGFQFEVDGTTVSGASGGDAASAGFTVSAGGSTVLGFSFTGATVSAGCGTLTTLSLNGEAYGLSGIVFSDTSGNGFDVTYHEPPDCASGIYDCLGICDGTAVEDCSGVCDGQSELDECGVCNGDGSSCVELYFNVDIEDTGESTLFIFQNSITSLDAGDELGIFDSAGILDSDGNNGEILVGSGVWNGQQLEITAITAVDLSQFGGPILPGAVTGHPMSLRVWDSSENVVYDVTYDSSSGNGSFNGLFTVVSEIYLCEIPDGACDCDGNILDDCGVCGGPGAVYDCGCSDVAAGACDCDGNVLDDCGVCGGSGVDLDQDGVCDDADDCVGAYDECDVCNGPGAVYECGCDDSLVCWDDSEVCDLNDCPIEPHFVLDIDETGESTLFIFQDSITNLDIDDQIGLFDLNGVIDSDGNTGEVLIGTGFWEGSQLEITAITSVDLSQFGGPILPGAVSGHPMSLKVWDNSDEIEFDVTYDIAVGSGEFNGLFTAISEVYLCDIPDGDCDCNGNTFDDCGVCGGPGAVYECGCSDVPEGTCDCDGNLIDECGVCGGSGVDADQDGICDDIDDCVGAYDECDVCNGPGAVYECGCSDLDVGTCDCDGNVLDECGVCGGSGVDADQDGICDDVDDCVGEYDDCEICNGPGAQQCWDGSDICGLTNCPPYFDVQIEETGESTLFIFQDSITSLGVGDHLGLYDLNGIIDSDGNNGEILVGSGIWAGNQLSVVAISSIDLSEFGGPILPGTNSGTSMVLKVWKADESIEYTVDYDVLNGSGAFDGLFSVVNEIYLCEIPAGACDCEGNVFDECGVCDGPGAVYECGCSDIPDGMCDCEGNFLDCSGECGGSAVEDECGVCDGDNSSCADCAGVPNGDAVVDECGVCQGDNSSCTVVLSFGNIIGTSMEILVETPIDIDDFEFTIDNSLVVFSGSSGGFSADYGYSVSILNQTISGSGGTIPSGSSGVLVNLAYQCDYSPIPTGISDDISISSSSGNVIAVFDGVLVNVGALGCTDSEACNYDPFAEEDDGTCVYIQEGECDCDGNVDADLDGICDSEDDCVGEYDDCGLCNGPGSSECWDGSTVCDLSDCPYVPYFPLIIEETGESTLFIFQDSISNIDVNDQIGLFDLNGLLDSDGNTGEVLVGEGIWLGTQLEIAAISSVDLSLFGGPVLPGSVSGNDMVLKVWDESAEQEYTLEYEISAGNGTFNGLFTVISEIYLCDIPDGACDCDGNVLDECGVCGGNGISDGECDCDGNTLDECGVCGGSGVDADEDGLCDDVDDCVGEYDSCGLCNGPGEEIECWDGSFVCEELDCPLDCDNCPEWDSNGDGYFDDISFYQNSGSITSAVYLDGLNIGSPNDLLGVFVNDELRGLGFPTEVPFGPLAGTYEFLTLIYSNEASGELVNFKFYDYESDQVYDISESVDFVSDMILGSVIDPLVMNVNIGIDISLDIPSGWNWMSLCIYNDDMTLNSTFSSIEGSAEFIKNQSSYADYYPGFGWFGTLSDINNVSMYKLKMIQDDMLSLSGMPVDVNQTIFDLGSGFNWIGYTPQVSLDVNTALSNIPEGNAQFIKNQSSYADYYGGFGWFGTLTNMDPLLGYIIKLNNDTQFTYNEGNLSRTTSAIVDLSDERFGLNIHDYEHNATITSSLYVDDTRVDNFDYTLVAFNGLSCVGYADGLYFPIDGNIIFPLMVYGNEEGANLTFKLYDNISNNYLDIDKEITFTPDMSLGNGFNPIEFHSLENPDNYVLSAAYPNPFNPVVNFDLEIEGSQYVDARVYNLSGQEIAVLHEGEMSGFNKINWMAVDQASGIYFIQVSIDGQIIANNKIILLK